MLSKNKWIIKPYDDSCASDIAEDLGLQYPMGALLACRGYETTEQARHYITKDTSVLHDPFLLSDMAQAVKRLTQGIENGEKITIYGDYDVDGITSVCSLYKYITSRGGRVDHYIPNRGTEGYGLNVGALERLIENGTQLIITVDTGITAIQEVAFANEKGVDVIVTDHHECADVLPRAAAIVNPKRQDGDYPFKELAGVGVVFKLISACEQYRVTGKLYTDEADADKNIEVLSEVCYKYADLTAIGTVADVMPLSNENRLIVSYGLGRLSDSENKGLNALIKASGISVTDRKITSSTISFTLAPRINAAGRMGTAQIAVELLLTDDDDVAENIAEQLCCANVDRQSEEQKIMEQAEEMIARDNLASKRKILVLDHADWHHGVIGIVASKLTEKYNIPSILISFEGDDKTMGKGSGRSIEGFNLHGALCECSEELERFGGHALAAGLTVSADKLEQFRGRIEEYAEKNISDEDTVKKIYADIELREEDASLDLAQELSLLEPYGTANPTPLFVLRDLTVEGVTSTSTNKHTRLSLKGDKEKFQCVMFGRTPESIGIRKGNTVDILFNLGVNEFKGAKKRQMIVRDVEFSQPLIQDIESNYMMYCDVAKGRILPFSTDVPDRTVCAEAFKYLKAHADTVLHTMHMEQELGISYVKLRLIVDIFSELGFITAEWNTPVELAITVIPQTAKKSLETSPLYKMLNSVE